MLSFKREGNAHRTDSVALSAQCYIIHTQTINLSATVVVVLEPLVASDLALNLLGDGGESLLQLLGGGLLGNSVGLEALKSGLEVNKVGLGGGNGGLDHVHDGGALLHLERGKNGGVLGQLLVLKGLLQVVNGGAGELQLGLVGSEVNGGRLGRESSVVAL
jgi:hypothetical protein